MRKEFITYSEAFKMQVVEEIRQGKFVSVLQAQKAYGICGMNTIQAWIKKYGKEELLPHSDCHRRVFRLGRTPFDAQQSP